MQSYPSSATERISDSILNSHVWIEQKKTKQKMKNKSCWYYISNNTAKKYFFFRFKDNKCPEGLKGLKKKKLFWFLLARSASKVSQRELLRYLRVLSRKKYGRRLCVVLELVSIRAQKNFKPRPHFLVRFKISDEHPRGINGLSNWASHSRKVTNLHRS